MKHTDNIGTSLMIKKCLPSFFTRVTFSATICTKETFSLLQDRFVTPLLLITRTMPELG